MGLLDKALYGGIEAGRWIFFHDVNNQSGLCGDYDPEAFARLDRCQPARIPLRTNCRNTLPIVKYVQDSLAADLGVSAVGDGPDVRVVEVTTTIDAVTKLQDELTRLIEHELFIPSDIVILSPVPFSKSICSQITNDYEVGICQLDEYSARASITDKIGFAEIENFKGLESHCVVLIDLPSLDSTPKCRANYYVGLSRAKVQLIIINCNYSATLT